LYTTVCSPKPNPNPNHNPKVITDPQIGRTDPQIVTVQIQIRPAPHFVVCRIIYGWGNVSSTSWNYETACDN